MAKDPAFLFYSSDFLTGTSFFTYEQKGQYITLLCMQHQQGHLQEKHVLMICGTHDNDVFKKFVRDSDGLYYNERLEVEVHKRLNYSESRRNNRLKGSKKVEADFDNISASYVRHMENENENISNSTGNKDNDNTIIPEVENFSFNPSASIDRYLELAAKDTFFVGQIYQKGVERVNVKGWLLAFNRRLTFTADTLKSEPEYRKHFANWLVKVPNYRTANPDEYDPIKDPEIKKVDPTTAGMTPNEIALMNKLNRK